MTADFSGFISMLQLNPYFPNNPHPIAVCRGVRLFIDPVTVRAFFVSSGPQAQASWSSPTNWDDSLAVMPPLALLLVKEKKKGESKLQLRADDQESSWFVFRHAEWGVQYFVCAITGEAQWYPPANIRNQVIEGPGAAVCWEPGDVRLGMNVSVLDGDDILTKSATRVFPSGSPTPAARRESLGDTSDLIVKANLAALESSATNPDIDESREEEAGKTTSSLPRTLATVNGWKICLWVHDARLCYQSLSTGESVWKVPQDILVTPISEWHLGGSTYIGGRAMSRIDLLMNEGSIACEENKDGQSSQLTRDSLENCVPIVLGASFSQFEAGQLGITAWLSTAALLSPLAPPIIPPKESIMYTYQNGLGLGLGLLPGKAGVVRTRRYSQETSPLLSSNGLVELGGDSSSKKEAQTLILSSSTTDDRELQQTSGPSTTMIQVQSVKQRSASVMRKIREHAAAVSRIPKKPVLTAAETFIIERDADRLWRNAEVARMRQKHNLAQGRAKESIAEARRVLADKTREDMLTRMHEVWKEEEERKQEVRERIESKRRASVPEEKYRRTSLGRAGSVISKLL
jgi:hypothetical protein